MFELLPKEKHEIVQVVFFFEQQVQVVNCKFYYAKSKMAAE